MNSVEQLSLALTERFGLEVRAQTVASQDGQQIKILPVGIAHTISFQIELTLGWRSVSAVFIPGNYASELLNGMRSASPAQKSAFSVFAKVLQSRGAEVRLEMDKRPVDACTPCSWPLEWSDIRIAMRKVGVIVEKPPSYDFQAVFPWATAFFGLSLSLLPLEEVVNRDPSVMEEEGAGYLTRAKRYERSRINRAACIEVHGTDCAVCGFSFGREFGDLGEGFIHVHHIIPVSEMGGSYAINPAEDLIPVCPNCHAMLHRRHPSLSAKELRVLIAK